MKQYGYIYKNYNEMKDFIRNLKLNNNDNILVQIFTGIIKESFIKKIISEINEIIPKAEIIGATTAGEIYKEDILTNSTLISFSVFEKTKVKTMLFNNNNDEYELGKSIVKDLAQKDTKVIILFTDGLMSLSENILNGIQSANKDIIVCGGKAADNGYLKNTYVFTKYGTTSKGVVAATLTGKDLNIYTEQSFGWSTIGKLMTVTEAKGNRIYTIDNIKAVDIYKKYLGEEIAKKLPMSATEFPLIVIKNGVHIARVAFGIYDDGSLSFSGNVEVNDKVQFGYGNVSILTEESHNIAKKLIKKNIEGLFIYSCSVRRAFMKDEIKLEINPLSKIADDVGFFTYGEFATINNTNKQLSVTMTILGMSETNKKTCKNELTLDSEEKPSKTFFEGKDIGDIKALTNLVNQATKELEYKNKKLKEQKFKIEQMNSITNYIMNLNNEMLSSGKVNSLLQMILDKAFEVIPNSSIGSIMLIENNKLCYRATRGYISNEVKNIVYNLQDIRQYTDYNINELYNPVIVKDIGKFLFNNIEEYNLWKNRTNNMPYELLTCGIGVDGQIKGFINVYNKNKDKAFDEEDKTMLKHLCCDIGIVLKNAELLKNIIFMSRYDSVTNVYNRNYFMELLKEVIIKAKETKEKFIICILDLNNLKRINDNYGHYAGDKIIKKFSTVVKNKIGENDIFARTGGDEFTIIFKNKLENVITIFKEIEQEFEDNPVDLEGDKKIVSFAYGLSEFGNDSDSITKLLKIADKRMYDKKKFMKKKLHN